MTSSLNEGGTAVFRPSEIKKELFHLTSTYTVTVLEDSYADLVISLCVAIDYVEMLESQSN